MKKFELWLDESGDFDNDSHKVGRGAAPSLVGGLLVEGSSFPDGYITAILPEKGTYHSVNESDQLVRFRKIEEKLYKTDTNRLVVFSNQERVMILDNNLTYLNVISEGILQLIKSLKVQYGDIWINVIIANRVDTTTGLAPGQSVVGQDEYVKRIKEKLLIGGLENAISEREWSIQTASARKDKRLMLADIICNTFFTRGREKKFTEEERNYIDSIYYDKEKTLIFTVFESLVEKEFKKYLIENKIGEAVACICTSENTDTLKNSFSLVRQKYLECGVYDIRFQYKFIESYIEYYINVVRDFNLCIFFLCNLLEYYVPVLQEFGRLGGDGFANQLALDIEFYLLTVYTHIGDVKKANELEIKCEERVNKLPVTLETISYRLKFETRKIVNLINCFEFDEALLRIDSHIKRCREIKEILGLMSDGETYYDELAKALGTRVQIKTFMLRKDGSLYESGKIDSEEAILEFSNQADKRRQYLYRVQLEIEHGDYEEALRFLKMSANLTSESSLKELWEQLIRDSAFGVNAYVKLMSESVNWNTSKEMYESLSKSTYITDILKQERLFHPSEIILWKYASYCANNAMLNAAQKCYDKAMAICFASGDITMNCIGLGIGFEMIAQLLHHNPKECRSKKSGVIKKWEQIHGSDELNIVEKVFGNVDFTQEETAYYMTLSKKITY